MPKTLSNKLLTLAATKINKSSHYCFLCLSSALLAVQLLDAPESQKLFPPDVLKRAKEYLDATGSGGTGAYTHSQGVELCREHVAKVIMLLLGK